MQNIECPYSRFLMSPGSAEGFILGLSIETGQLDHKNTQVKLSKRHHTSNHRRRQTGMHKVYETQDEHC